MAERLFLTHLSSMPAIMINICENGQGQLADLLHGSVTSWEQCFSMSCLRLTKHTSPQWETLPFSRRVSKDLSRVAY